VGADEHVQIFAQPAPNPPQAISGETVAHTISGTKKAAA
jgi:hypothetical protein